AEILRALLHGWMRAPGVDDGFLAASTNGRPCGPPATADSSGVSREEMRRLNAELAEDAEKSSSGSSLHLRGLCVERDLFTSSGGGRRSPGRSGPRGVPARSCQCKCGQVPALRVPEREVV